MSEPIPPKTLLESYKLVLGQMCKNCHGDGFVVVHTGASNASSIIGTCPCPLCGGRGIFIKLATRKETLELLRMIPDLVEDALEPALMPPCESEKGFCQNVGPGLHYPDCRNY